MAWSVFLPVILLGYTAYYALNILYDLMAGRRKKGATAGGVQYSVDDLAAYEEAPTEVPYDLEYPDDIEDHQEQVEYEEDDEFEEEEPVVPISIAPTPTLQVEGQGIPLEQFIKEAKSYSSSIF
ncbi:hypothetical protein [Pontibacter litorisediminis]|uniref:hypothetical protein n=1 Tax=Pontibacter litorisediminis TaxID=1846260 RepID=UPI0023EDAB85|nr:hypothetical protein [Pontibacter litorisediminis]